MKGRNIFKVLCSGVDKFEHFQGRDLANSLWALAVGGHAKDKEEAFVRLWELATVGEEADGNDFTIKEYAQLYHARMIAGIEGVELPESRADVFVKIEESVNELTGEDFDDEHHPTPSDLWWGLEEDPVDAISEILKGVGFSHERRVSPSGKDDGFLTISFACQEDKVAIQLNKSKHFLKTVKMKVREQVRGGGGRSQSTAGAKRRHRSA